jgi:hypothetical protein
MSDEDSENETVLSQLKSVEQSLTLSIEELKANYNNIKQEIMDVIPIVRDFKGLLQRKPLFERSSFTYLNPLAKEIKSEIMREVSSKLIGPSEELKGLKVEVKSALDEVFEKTADFKPLVQELKAENASLHSESELIKENLDILQRNIDDAREDIMLKAPLNEIARLAEKIATKASAQDLEQTMGIIEKLPTGDMVERLYHQIETLNYQMISFASKDMVKEMEVGLISNVETKFERYIDTETLNNEIERVLSLLRDTNEGIDMLKAKQDKIANMNKREIEKIQKLLQLRPWTKDIELVSTFIDDKCTQKDFEKFQKEVVPQINFFDEKVNLFAKRIERFDKILERYDEILLDKASKDDVLEIKSFLPKLLLAADFEYFKDIDVKQKEMLDQKLIISQTSVHEVDEKISKFNSSYKSVKSQLKDFNAKYSSIKELETQLESKADKSDIYAMFDYTARREAVKINSQALEVLHKQIEMAVMLQLATLKTLLKNTDSAAFKNRQRTEVFNNLNSLIEWVSNSNPPEVDKMVDNARMVLGISQRKLTPQEPESPEPMLPLLSSTRKYKRQAISLTPAPEDKSFTEF